LHLCSYKEFEKRKEKIQDEIKEKVEKNLQSEKKEIQKT
jgi:hypothetical protein